MKKIILSIAVLAVLFTTSCKKAYECVCDETYSYSYEALFSAYSADAAAANQNAANDQTDNYASTVTTLDKTTKAAANAACTSSETVTTWEEDNDYSDADSDGDFAEAGLKGIQTTKSECSLEKK